MKNLFLYISIIVILPTSFGSSESKGCNSEKSEISEDNTAQKKEKSDEEESENADKKGGKSDVSCYPFLSIE